MSTDDDDELAARMRAGDAEALASLFERSKDALKRMIAMRIDVRLNGRIAASDVVQDAYLEAAKRLHHFAEQPDVPARVWLRWIAAQHLVDLHRRHLGTRKRDAGRELSLERGAWPQASSGNLANLLAGTGTSPSQGAAREEEKARVLAALDHMEPIDREILALRHFEELTNVEVAEVLGLERSAASKRYVRALARLRTVLAPADAPTRTDEA